MHMAVTVTQPVARAAVSVFAVQAVCAWLFIRCASTGAFARAVARLSPFDGDEWRLNGIVKGALLGRLAGIGLCGRRSSLRDEGGTTCRPVVIGALWGEPFVPCVPGGRYLIEHPSDGVRHRQNPIGAEANLT